MHVVVRQKNTANNISKATAGSSFALGLPRPSHPLWLRVEPVGLVFCN